VVVTGDGCRVLTLADDAAIDADGRTAATAG
jgi:hypothetical protein